MKTTIYRISTADAINNDALRGERNILHFSRKVIMKKEVTTREKKQQQQRQQKYLYSLNSVAQVTFHCILSVLNCAINKKH